jgi:hypothetical protein
LAAASQAQPALPQSAWDGTSYNYLDKTPVKGLFLDTGGSANTVAYTSPDPIMLASAGGIMSDAASPQEEAMMRMQGRQIEPWGTNPVYQNANGENIAVNPLSATTVRATPIPALLDAETYTPRAYDYTNGSRALLSTQVAELGTPGNPGVARNLSDWEAFTSMTAPGQMLRGALDRLDGIGDMAVQAVVHPAAPIVNGIGRYLGAYQQGHLGDTILNDFGGTVQGLVKSTPVGLVDALYKRDAAGGMERLGGALFDNTVAAAGAAAQGGWRRGLGPPYKQKVRLLTFLATWQRQ